jgi:LysR family nitrogen assimilation transcriptional regulator
MTSARIHLHQLSYFVGAAELGSMSAAAQMLRVSQPTVTASIAKLEKDLGVKLFYRDHSGTHVTPAGNALLSHARDIVSRIDAAVSDMDRLRKTEGKTQKAGVRLGIMPQVSQVLLTPLVEQHVRRYPNIDLIIKECPGNSMFDLIERGELDIALSNIGRKSALVQAERIIAQEFYLIGPPQGTKGNDEPIGFTDLCHYPLIQGAIDGTTERGKNLQRLAKERHTTLEFDVNAPVTVRKQLMKTLGRYSVSLYFLFNKEIAVGELAARSIRAPGLMQYIYLIRRKHHGAKTAETIVCNLIKSQVNRMIRQSRYRWHPPGWKVSRDAVELDVIGMRKR